VEVDYGLIQEIQSSHPTKQVMANLDYLNLNSVRNYPIKDGLGRVSDDGLFTIPNSLIVDLSLCATGNDSPDLYISRINCNSSSLLIEISANGIGVFGTFQTTLPLSDYNTDLSMNSGVAFPTSTGMITIGSADDLADLPSGDFTFSINNTELLMKVYGPGNTGISWMSFSDAKGNNAVLSGYIQMQGNSNIQFRNQSGVIYMDAGENLGLNKNCGAIPQPVRFINGISPDSNGNFTLIPQSCVTIDTAQYGLVISDSCGQPCLGCAAIDTLTTQVNGLESSILGIKNFTTTLQAAINQAAALLNYPCAC